MKYRALIEKLDWKGRVRTFVREYEDDFTPDLSDKIRDFALTGKADADNLPDPPFKWFRSMAEKIAPARADRSFDSYEHGVQVIAGEFYPGLGVQLVARGGDQLRWERRSEDAIPEGAGEEKP
jgi:hypothetical protein